MHHQFSQFQQEVQSERWEHQPLLGGAAGDAGMLVSPTNKLFKVVHSCSLMPPKKDMTGKPSSVSVMVGKSGGGNGNRTKGPKQSFPITSSNNVRPFKLRPFKCPLVCHSCGQTGPFWQISKTYVSFNTR